MDEKQLPPGVLKPFPGGRAHEADRVKKLGLALHVVEFPISPYASL
jgi:hypothetical protein